MRPLLLALCALAAGLPACLAADTNHTILNVTVFYESLCPDSKTFINMQLYPVFQNLSDHLNLTMVPFGNANLTSNHNYSCQHKDVECFGNRVQTCALYLVNVKMDQSMEYVNCLMNGTSLKTNQSEYEQLMKNNCTSVTYDAIQGCMGKDEEWNKEEDLQNLTKKNNITGVPTVHINGKMMDDTSTNGIFKQQVCSLLSEEKLPYCKSSSTSLYGSLLLLVGAYLLSQLH